MFGSRDVDTTYFSSSNVSLLSIAADIGFKFKVSKKAKLIALAGMTTFIPNIEYGYRSSLIPADTVKGGGAFGLQVGGAWEYDISKRLSFRIDVKRIFVIKGNLMENFIMGSGGFIVKI
jgi:hypothetical protein